jgi:hypothetical protein
MKVNHLEPSISKLPPPRPVPVPKRGFLFSSAAICEQTAWKIPRDLLLSGEDIRGQPLIERKTALKGYSAKREGASSTSNTLMVTATNYLLPFANSGLRELSQRN